MRIIADKDNLDLEKQSDINDAIEKAIGYIGEVVKTQIEERGGLYTHDKFFKEIPTNVLIREHIEQKYKGS